MGKTARKKSNANTALEESNGAVMEGGELNRFKECKRDLIEIVDGLENSIEEAHSFFGNLNEGYGDVVKWLEAFACTKANDSPPCEELVFTKEGKDLIDYKDRVKKIKEVVQRDNMKVVFLGHTSNGKSTVINSLLGGKVLPVGFGHTTDCFVCVQGTEESSGYLCAMDKNGMEEKKDVKSVKQIANALCHMDSSANGDAKESGDQKQSKVKSGIVNLHWPISQCSLLKHGVVLVDSPGMDMTSDYDQWIDNHCLDADLFVLVANGESTLKLSERNFFIKVKDKIANPNIFILYNRWDCSDPGDEEEEEEDDGNAGKVVQNVKKQHMNNCYEFLKGDLNCLDQAADVTNGDVEDLVKERVFFISGKEALSKRTGSFIRGNDAVEARREERYRQFVQFERYFGKCLSQSAIRTRFEHHSRAAGELIHGLEEIYCLADGKLNSVKDACAKSEEHLKAIQERFQEDRLKLEKELEESSHAFKVRCRKHLARDLFDLIENCTTDIVKSFRFPENFKENKWSEYCSQLDAYVGDKVNADIGASLSNMLAIAYEAQLQSMYGSAEFGLAFSDILKREYFDVVAKEVIASNRTGHDLMKLHLDCTDLSQYFHPDLSFHFSLGWPKIRKVLVESLIYLNRNVISDGTNEPVQFVDEKTVALASDALMLAPSGSGYAAVTAFASAFITYVKPSSTLFKVIVFGGVVYSCIYAFERYNFTPEAQEQLLKNQYTASVGDKLKNGAKQMAGDLCISVEFELTSHKNTIDARMNMLNKNLESRIAHINTRVEGLNGILEEGLGSSRALKALGGKLGVFERKYMQH
eukprot:Nk52_evm1s279 gene=Nk52_evmTU1s279